MTATNRSTQSGASALTQHTFNAFKIAQRKGDGYLNATTMCKAVGKQIAHYNANAQTKDFLNALSTENGIPLSVLYQSVKGGNGTQGTWVHPKIAIHLAQWLSPEFAVQVIDWVYEWKLGGNGHQAPVLTSTENTPDVQHWITTQSPGQPPVTRQIDISVLLELSNDFPDFCMVPTQQLEALTSLLSKVSSKGMDLLQFGTNTNVSH